MIELLTSTQQQTVRKMAAELVRAWADRRMVTFDKHGQVYAQQERLVVTREQRELFEACADDLEWCRR